MRYGMRASELPATVVLAVLLAAGCGGGSGGSSAATPTPVATHTATTAPTSSPSPTETPVPTHTATNTPEPSPTATPTSSLSAIVDELTAVGLDRYLNIEPSDLTQNGAWEEYGYDPAAEGAICLRGTPYQVNLRRGTTNKVVLYLEGGGACWNFANCWENPTATLRAGSATNAGILNTSEAANPFADWNVVYASYCDGSVFSGDNIADYEGNATYHHGLQNLSAAVALMRREFPNPEMIFVSGSSAGGYGTLSGYGVTRVAYPETPILVFDDSGPGLQNPDDPEATAERIANWKFTESIPANCDNCSEQLTYLAAWSLQRDPTLRVAYFSYLRDAVMQFFLNMDGQSFETLLLQVTGDIHGRFPGRFKRYFPAGNSHTVLQRPDFFSVVLDGTSVRDWTADFLVDGPAWQDLSAAARP